MKQEASKDENKKRAIKSVLEKTKDPKLSAHKKRASP
jgi:hypothetical protein